MITQSSSAYPDCKTQLCTGGDKLVNCQWSTNIGRSWAKDLQQTNTGKIKCELFEVLLFTKTKISGSLRVMAPYKATNENEYIQVRCQPV